MASAVPYPQHRMPPTTPPQTWHHGLIAKWWAEFNQGGPELPYFQKHVERGQPALDVACGTGRLLIPFLKAGLDVDGCDVSPDMVALCRERAEHEGLAPTLFVQPMAELDPPRRYRTIYVCGGFGRSWSAGGTRTVPTTRSRPVSPASTRSSSA
jgi:SAM-dependent methyltransferase